MDNEIKIIKRDEQEWYRKGKWCAEKTSYIDSNDTTLTSCCLWYPLDENISCGLSIDFDYEQIDDIISLLQHLKNVEPFVEKGNK